MLHSRDSAFTSISRLLASSKFKLTYSGPILLGMAWDLGPFGLAKISESPAVLEVEMQNFATLLLLNVIQDIHADEPSTDCKLLCYNGSWKYARAMSFDKNDPLT